MDAIDYYTTEVEKISTEVSKQIDYFFHHILTSFLSIPHLITGFVIT